MAASPEETPVDLQAAVEGIELDLRFEIGRTRMAVKDVASLEPGYVFELATPAELPVTILANGRAVGRGRLVQIADRVGVQFMKGPDHG